MLDSGKKFQHRSRLTSKFYYSTFLSSQFSFSLSGKTLSFMLFHWLIIYIQCLTLYMLLQKNQNKMNFPQIFHCQGQRKQNHVFSILHNPPINLSIFMYSIYIHVSVMSQTQGRTQTRRELRLTSRELYSLQRSI